jgi:molecular chaperone DnaK (HSP70)
MVIDVGGTHSYVSIVDSRPDAKEDWEVRQAVRLDLAGDAFVGALVHHMCRKYFPASSSGDHPEQTMEDGMALQRLHDAASVAVQELSQNTRTQINIPYLTMDLNTRQPIHADFGISRNMLETYMNEWIVSTTTATKQQNENQEQQHALSSSMAPPKNLMEYFLSVLFHVLETSHETPMSIQTILVVGGGARSPLVQSALQQAWFSMGGTNESLLIPPPQLLEELVVLGAATTTTTTTTTR